MTIQNKTIVDVAEVATETATERISKTMSNGKKLVMNTHSRLGFTLGLAVGTAF